MWVILKQTYPHPLFLSILNFHRPVRLHPYLCYIKTIFVTAGEPCSLCFGIISTVQTTNRLLTLLLKCIKLCTCLGGWSVFIPLMDNRWHYNKYSVFIESSILSIKLFIVSYQSCIVVFWRINLELKMFKEVDFCFVLFFCTSKCNSDGGNKL